VKLGLGMRDRKCILDPDESQPAIHLCMNSNMYQTPARASHVNNSKKMAVLFELMTGGSRLFHPRRPPAHHLLPPSRTIPIPAPSVTHGRRRRDHAIPSATHGLRRSAASRRPSRAVSRVPMRVHSAVPRFTFAGMASGGVGSAVVGGE